MVLNMSRIMSKTKPIVLSWIPLSTLFQDGFESKIKESATITLKEETGWDRVKKVFQTDKDSGTPSKELLLIYSYMSGGVMIGAVVGGFINTRNATQDFMERNVASRFLSNMDARRRLRDYVMIRLAIGIKQWCPKITAFSSIYGASTVILNAYTGDATVTNYILSGMITGGLCKMNLGITGIVAGATLGGFLSGTLNGVYLLLMKLTGMTMEEILEYHKKSYDNSRKLAPNLNEPSKGESSVEADLQESSTNT